MALATFYPSTLVSYIVRPFRNEADYDFVRVV